MVAFTARSHQLMRSHNRRIERINNKKKTTSKTKIELCFVSFSLCIFLLIFSDVWNKNSTDFYPYYLTQYCKILKFNVEKFLIWTFPKGKEEAEVKKLNVSLKIDFSCVNVNTSSAYSTDKKIQMPLELQVEILLYFTNWKRNEQLRDENLFKCLKTEVRWRFSSVSAPKTKSNEKKLQLKLVQTLHMEAMYAMLKTCVWTNWTKKKLNCIENTNINLIHSFMQCVRARFSSQFESLSARKTSVQCVTSRKTASN